MGQGGMEMDDLDKAKALRNQLSIQNQILEPIIKIELGWRRMGGWARQGGLLFRLETKGEREQREGQREESRSTFFLFLGFVSDWKKLDCGNEDVGSTMSALTEKETNKPMRTNCLAVVPTFSLEAKSHLTTSTRINNGRRISRSKSQRCLYEELVRNRNFNFTTRKAILVPKEQDLTFNGLPSFLLSNCSLCFTGIHQKFYQSGQSQQ